MAPPEARRPRPRRRGGALRGPALALALALAAARARPAPGGGAWAAPGGSACRRGALGWAAAGALGWGLGATGTAAESLYLSSRSGRDTYFRYDADGNLADVVKADLAVRVVRPPLGPSTCYGAEDGDFLSIRYSAAYEIPGTKDLLSPSEDAALDLLISPESGGGRWQVYDTSQKRGGVFRLPLGNNNAIAGVDIGLHGMCQGEKRVLYIPAQLAYAERGNKAFGIPPNAAVRYDVELEGVMQMGRRAQRATKGYGDRRVPGRQVQ